MALQMTHMVVAYKLAEHLKIKENTPEFILGSIAPDSVWFSDSYMEKKIHSHCFECCGPWGETQDYVRWIENIKEFWNKYVTQEKDSRTKAFLIGLCVHNLTDYCFDIMIWSVLKKKLIPPMTFDEFKEVYYPEARRFDEWLYQNCECTKEIFDLLDASKELDFEDYVFAENQVTMKKHFAKTQYNIQEKVDASVNKYFTFDMHQYFIEEAPNKICELIKGFLYNEK